MEMLINLTQLLLSLSILVFVHEFGHFFTAKMFGMRVPKFYIFFDAGDKRIWSTKIGDTEYGIGWLPLGGYVQISGMIDETQSKEDLSPEPEPWEFRAKPAWQRLIVMVGGVVMNIITGIIVFTFYLYSLQKEYIPMSEINKGGIYASELGQEVGLQTGDKIIGIDGQEVTRFKDASSARVYLGGTVNIERNGQRMDVPMPDTLHKYITRKNITPLFAPRYQDIGVEMVAPNSYAEAAGLKAKDEIYAINGEKVENFPGLQSILGSNKNGAVSITVMRNGNKEMLTSKVDSLGRLGFMPSIISSKKVYDWKRYSFAEAFNFSFKEGYEIVATQVIAIGLMIRGKMNFAKNISSPIGIMKNFGGTWDWARFWLMTGLLSFILAFMNILPIPALDGGHIMIIGVESIIGRKLTDTTKERLQLIGIVLLLALMVFAFGKDILELMGFTF